MAITLIRLTLLEGDPDSLRMAEIAGRTTKLIAGPISAIDRLLARPEAQRPAVYFLYGTDFEQTSDAIYVGECDAIARRFNGQHDAMKKAEWRQLVAAFSSDAIFNSAHGRRAEHLLVEQARRSARATVLTLRSGRGDLDEGDAAIAGQFAADVTILAETLGFPAFRSSGLVRPRGTSAGDGSVAPIESDEALFRFIGETRFQATMRVEGDDFIVLKDSVARPDETTGCADSIRALRARLRDAGALVHDPITGLLRLERDVPLNSTSAAGGLIAGRNSRGPNEWVHVRSGQTYALWIEAKQAAQAVDRPSPAIVDA